MEVWLVGVKGVAKGRVASFLRLLNIELNQRFFGGMTHQAFVDWFWSDLGKIRCYDSTVNVPAPPSSNRALRPL